MLGVITKRISFSLVVLIFSSCLDSFDPPLDLESKDLLVIDGFLNSTDRNVMVSISHAQSLSSDGPVQQESGATVEVYTEGGGHFLLTENQPGVYVRENLTVDPGGKYQLRIKTSNGQEFHSDYEVARTASQITSVSMRPTDDESAMEVYLSAKGNISSTRFYRWDFLETWEYTAAYKSEFVMVNRRPEPRPLTDGIYRCYKTQMSTKILVGTSIQLNDDIVSDQLIHKIPVGDPRTFERYSIEVRQRAITRNEFDYLRQLQKSTEQLGGLFDPTPSQLYGNLKNITTASVPVLGYFSVGSTAKSRIFYDHDDLPEGMQGIPRTQACKQDTVCMTLPNDFGLNCKLELKTLTGQEVVTGTIFREFETIGLLITTSECADCRLQGGSTSMPPFW